MNLLQAGAKAPDFNTTDQSGKKVTLKDYRGKRVVLYFYPKDDTPGCTKEACAFRDHFARHREALSVDCSRGVSDWRREMRLSHE